MSSTLNDVGFVTHVANIMRLNVAILTQSMIFSYT